MIFKSILVTFLLTLPAWGQVRSATEAPVVPFQSLPSGQTALPDHKVVPNDQISILVYDEPTFSKITRVGSDGTVLLPELQSPVRVEGLLPREIEDQIARRLVDEQILIHPLVTVSITDYAFRLINIVGNVKYPGQISITNPITLLNALSRAGWITQDAGADLLLTINDADAPRKISIHDLQMGTDPSLNVMLTGGEVINVPDAQKVWVTGNVARPSPVPFRTLSDATVLKVIASAGGLTQYYNKTAYIYRLDTAGTRREIPVQLRSLMHRKVPDVQLFSDDILLVPDDNGTNRRALLQTLQNLAGAGASAAVITGMHP